MALPSYIGCIEGQAGPDAAEGHCISGGKGLSVEDDPDNQVTGRGNVLHQAHCRQFQLPGGHDKEHQREDGDDAGPDEHQVDIQAGMQESGLSPQEHYRQPDGRDGRQQNDL